MNKLLKIVFLLLLIIFGLLSCFEDVPHDNPLDSHNKNQGFTLEGKVNTYYAPVTPITNAIVTLLPDNIKIFTNNSGDFQFSGLAPGLYTILCNAEGFSEDSIQIDLDANISIVFNLDGLPFFENILLTTHHVSRFFPVEDMFFLQIDAWANDLDGISDINNVLYKIPEYNITDTLQTTLETGVFSKRLSIDDLPVNTIQTLIGREFILSVSDDLGITVNSDTHFLTRIIEITPVINEPANLQVISTDSITFYWEKIRLPFWFMHKIGIFQINQGLLSKVTEIDNIINTQTEITIENRLSAAEYVWILSVFDEFGNSSSSKEGTFRVSN